MGLFEVIRRILHYLRPYPVLVLGTFFYLALSIGLDLAGPKLLGTALNTLRLSPGASTPSLAELRSVLLVYGLCFLGAGLLAQLFNFRKELLRTKLSTRVLCDLRVQLYAAIQGLCFRFHDVNRSGELITKTTRDIYRIHSFYAETIFLAAEFTVMGGGAALLIALTDLRLLFLAFSTFPFAGLVIWRTAAHLREMSREVGDRYDEVTQVLQESIAGVRVVKAFAKESREIDKFEDRVGTFVSRVIRTADYFTLNLPLAAALFNVSIPLTLGGGALLVLKGSVGLGDLAATIFYLTKISTLMRVLNRIVQTTEEAAASADRVFDILDAEPSVKDHPNARSLPPGGPGGVEFEEVEFSYRTDVPTLRGLSLRVEPGETIGIVGPTGSGKTTLMALIPRFYEVTSGRILIDGVDVREVPGGERDLPGYLSLLRNHRREHRLRQAGYAPGRNRALRQGGPDPRLHRRPGPRLPHGGGGTGDQPVGGPEAADLHRPRVPDQAPRPDHGRLHRLGRRRNGAPPPARHGRDRARAHDVHHRPAAVIGDRRRSHRPPR
jgi:ATP-binding cassette subfamily B protein